MELAYFLTSSREQADDISQEVFLMAYRYGDTFRGQSSAKTWLLRITRNTVYSWSKKNAKWKRLFQGNDIPHGS
ncbi:RNA polymerase sigma factor [Paenibacillus sp. CN-4]|uniref:RNA polymerase sigma factor n=1 Tax=Paenibacillus nanchangensis TaxID=3348343 RepID=UPI00397D5D57